MALSTGLYMDAEYVEKSILIPDLMLLLCGIYLGTRKHHSLRDEWVNVRRIGEFIVS